MRYNKGKQNSNKKNEYITLPYDFIPMADTEKRHFPYTKEIVSTSMPCASNSNPPVPKHNRHYTDRLSGVLTYKMTPYSDMAIEIREKWGGGFFVSGSQVRGKVRSNLEILSASYPAFIDRAPMLYRDISSTNYRKRIVDNQDLERSIQVGFLRKVDNQFLVTPAKQIGNKYFLSIKEHRLMKMRLGSTDQSFSPLFNWNGNKNEEHLNKLDELQKHVERKTNRIEKIKDQLGDIWTNINSDISDVFKEYHFFGSLKSLVSIVEKNKSFDYTRCLGAIAKKLRENLNSKWNKRKNNFTHVTEEVESAIDKLFLLMVERWEKKAGIYLTYFQLKKRSGYFPYQKNVFFKRTPDDGIEHISFRPSDDTPEKGYLFNSTNASSKRSHYFVMGPDQDKEEYVVPQSVISAYNRNLKKFRTTDGDKQSQEEIIQFYDIFNQYDQILKKRNRSNGGGIEGIIVFFKTNKTNNEISDIGRTPYFKVPHKTQLADLLGPQEADKLDYASALFGFITDEQEKNEQEAKKLAAYKSRLRFSPTDLEGVPIQGDVHGFVLMSPFASASAMYLRQRADGSRITYESKKEQVQLNGYKYYHVLRDPLTPNPQKEHPGIASSRKVVRHDGLQLTGKVHFLNLTREELGLLLLSLDWKQLYTSRKFDDYLKGDTDLAGFRDRAGDAYELIGGAKPYGFGKVKIDVQELHIEKKGNDFESLVLAPMEQQNEWHEYIDEFIESMGGIQYFERVHFKHYIQSKMENSNDDKEGDGTESNPRHINWENIGAAIRKANGGKKGGGYHKTWRLKSNRNKFQ